MLRFAHWGAGLLGRRSGGFPGCRVRQRGASIPRQNEAPLVNHRLARKRNMSKAANDLPNSKRRIAVPDNQPFDLNHSSNACTSFLAFQNVYFPRAGACDREFAILSDTRLADDSLRQQHLCPERRAEDHRSVVLFDSRLKHG